MPNKGPLVGRGEELRVVADALGARPTSGVVIAGSAGVGKTRLAREALGAAARGGAATLWAAATASAASIPLGALAHLLPPVASRAPPDPLEQLRQASAALVEAARGQRLVVGVDDAHLLDAASATVVHQLALTGVARLVVTVRSGELAPDAVVALWKDGLAERLEVQPLARPEVDQLLTAVLGTPVDSATLERLWRLTRGNALFLYEVIEGAKEAGQLTSRGGVWRWQGQLTPTARLGELIGSRLARLGSDAGRLVQMLALAEPLGARLAGELVSPDALAEIDRAGMVMLEEDGRRRQVRLSHPLYAEVVRAQTSGLCARDVRQQLAGALGSYGLRRRGDVLRQATLELDAGQGSNHDVLTVAAAEANAAFDPVLAERLARAALAAGAGVGAHLVLGNALNWQGRVAEADAVLAAAAALASCDEEHAAAALVWGPTLFWGRGRGEEAEAVLAQAEDRIADAGVVRGISAVRSAFALFTGRPHVAVEIAAPVLSLPSDPDAVLWAAMSTSYALARCGRTAEALQVNEMGWSVVGGPEMERVRPSQDQAEFSLLQCELTALWAAGRHKEAEARGAAFHAHVLHRRDQQQPAVPCLLRGQAALAAGRPTSAARWLREADAEFVDNDPVGWLHWCLLSLAEALAITNDPAGAATALARAREVRRPTFVLWAPDALLAEAWVAAGSGELTEAASLAREAGQVAGASGQWAVEAAALHTAVRLGDQGKVAGRLRELAGKCDGCLVDTFSDHADALAAGDGTGLDQVSVRFDAMGARLLAAEAASQASVAHERAGRRASSWASAGRAHELAEGCEGADTPELGHTRPALPLSRREREVAGLAARGLSNRTIAERLTVSVRTVEGHLDRVYAKLGIAGRGELALVLGVRSPMEQAPSP